MEAAGVVHQHDPDFAADLFDRAVRAAEGIDADAGVRLRTIAYIAAGAAGSGAIGHESPANLARSLTGALEDATPFVFDPEERLPHQLVLDVAAQLRGPTGLATALRWAHENRTNLADALATVLPRIVASRTLGLANAFWLLRLLGTSGAIVDAADPIVTAAASSGPGGRTLAATQLGVLARWVARDTNPEQRRAAANDLCKLADRIGLNDLAGVTDTRQFAQALRELEPSQDPGTFTTSRDWFGKDDQAEEELTLTGDLSSIEEDLAKLTRRYVNDEIVVDHLVTTARTSTPSARVATLDRLIGLVERKVPGARARIIAAAVRTLLSSWSSSTRIRTWAAQRLPTFLTDHLPELFTGGSDPDGAYVTSVALPAEPKALHAALVEATAAHLEGLTTAHLHAVTRVLSDILLDPQTRASVVHSALTPAGPVPDSPLAARVAQSRQDRRSLAAPPEDQTALLAAALWSLLGHEDRRYRWLAAHTLRLLLTRGPGASLTRKLWELADRAMSAGTDPSDDPSSFRAPDLEFLTMSAVQWLLLVIARVAHEEPDVIVPIVDDLVRCALNTSRPHASIRELARQDALAIAPTHPEAVAAATVDRLRFANTPAGCSVDQAPLRGSSNGIHTRFHFGAMETVPYWLKPLARVFHDVTTADVARLADAWITDRWGRGNSEDRDPWLNRNEDSWELTNNYKGSTPTVEILPTYLEYHALLSAAGELVDAGTPLEVDYRGQDADDPWEQWLAAFLPQSVDVWRVDVRQATPVRPVTSGAWSKIAPRSPTTVIEDQPHSSAGSADFEPDAAVRQMLEELRGLDEDREMVLVNGSVSTHKHDWSCSAWMTTALVIPAAGRSLLHALAEGRAQPHSLPYAGAGVSSWDEIDVPGLQLRGWLVEERPDREGMDNHDPLACGLNHRLTFPATDTLTAMSLTPDPAKIRYTDPYGVLGARVHCWAEEDKFRWRGQTPHESSGDYLVIRRDLLNDFLRKREVSLVAVVHASLYRPRRSGEPGGETWHTATSYLLIHPDGTEERLDARAS